MNNKLEGFVRDNKKQFEVSGPSDKLWGKIAAELDKKPEKKTITKRKLNSLLVTKGVAR